MNDGPLIVQSDKTLLLEVDHPAAADCRKAIAPFAELERSPEHIHTYRLTPLGLWNARAAGHDAEQVVDTLLEYSRYSVPHALLVDVAETMARYGRLRLEKHPVHGLVLVSNDRPVLEEVLRAKKVAGMMGARIDADTVAVHPSRARQPQAGAAQDRLAGRGLRRVRRRRGARDRARRVGLVDAAVPEGGRRVVLARRLRRRRPPLRCRQDHGRRGGDGRGQGDHADPRHQHRQRAAVEGRADATHVADRRGDRRVQRLGQGDPARHDRDVPGDDDAPEGRLHPPRAPRRPRLGPHRLRRGAPAAGADLPDDRRPPGPPPARPDRHPGARGRPRGRRVLADRPEAVRRAVEGHRVPGLDRAGRLRRGACDAAGLRADGVRRRRARGALPARVLHPPQGRRRTTAGRRSTPASRRW